MVSPNGAQFGIYATMALGSTKPFAPALVVFLKEIRDDVARQELSSN